MLLGLLYYLATVDYEKHKLNKMMIKIAVWTDADLDGAASYLVLKWMLLDNCDCKVALNTCSPSKLRVEYLKWLQNNKNDDFDKIIIMDLDTTVISDLIDCINVTIFDHHESHFSAAKNYKHATAHVRMCDSTAQLVYENLKSKQSNELSASQKSLILHVSDYDSYKLAFKQTKKLNCLYWTFTGNRVETFAKEFSSGFNNFTQLQENAIALYNKKLKEVIERLQMFRGQLDKWKIASTFCETAHNDVAEYVLESTNADIVMLVNPKQQTVSFRKNNACTADLSKIADNLCSGGGHESAAGGKITENFLLFAKTLTPCNA